MVTIINKLILSEDTINFVKIRLLEVSFTLLKLLREVPIDQMFSGLMRCADQSKPLLKAFKDGNSSSDIYEICA